VRIKLTYREIIQGSFVGMMRQVQCLKMGSERAHGADPDKDWQTHIEGALGEMAFSKAIGLYWTAITKFKGPDVGGVSGYEVRTRPVDYYDLLIRPHEVTSSKYVLLTGRNGEYTIRGWYLGTDAKQEQWLKTYGGRPPAYFVPQSQLHKDFGGWEKNFKLEEK